MKKIISNLFVLVVLVIIIYPAIYIYQNPSLLVTITQAPEIASSEEAAPTLALLATATLAPEIASSAPTPQPACLVVRALPGGDGKLNLRSGAGTSYAVLAILQDGQELTEEGQSGEWYGVTIHTATGNISGYVHSSYVEPCE